MWTKTNNVGTTPAVHLRHHQGYCNGAGVNFFEQRSRVILVHQQEKLKQLAAHGSTAADGIKACHSIEAAMLRNVVVCPV